MVLKTDNRPRKTDVRWGHSIYLKGIPLTKDEIRKINYRKQYEKHKKKICARHKKYQQIRKSDYKKWSSDYYKKNKEFLNFKSKFYYRKYKFEKELGEKITLTQYFAFNKNDLRIFESFDRHTG